MPLYEYECRACGRFFETLVRGSQAPSCPSCQSTDLERIPSTVSVTTAEKLKAAVDSRRRKLSKTTWREQREAQAELERHHRH